MHMGNEMRIKKLKLLTRKNKKKRIMKGKFSKKLG